MILSVMDYFMSTLLNSTFERIASNAVQYSRLARIDACQDAWLIHYLRLCLGLENRAFTTLLNGGRLLLVLAPGLEEDEDSLSVSVGSGARIRMAAAAVVS